MSFSFRNLFAQDENGNPLTGDRTEGAPEPGIPGVQEYDVSELLPFIPPAIVAQNGIPMDKSIQIILPEDGSNDVRLSTIYQSCPSLFAAEITPLNDSVVNLPPKPEQATTVPPPLSGNPFGDDMGNQPETRAPETMTEDRTTPPALPETHQEAESPNFGFSPPQELSQNDGNPFSGTPQEVDPSPQVETPAAAAPEASQPAAPAANNPFGDIPAASASPESPFETDSDVDASPETPSGEQGQALSDFFSAPVNPEGKGENPFGNAQAPQDQASPEAPAGGEESPEAAVFGTESDSFATLFSQAAEEDKDLPVSGSSVEDNGPSVEFMLNEGQGEYVGPSVDPSVSPFAGMDGDKDENLGFESFIPPNMQEEENAPSPDPVAEESGFAPLVHSDEISSPAEIFNQVAEEAPKAELPEPRAEFPAPVEEKPEPSPVMQGQPDQNVEVAEVSSPEPETQEVKQEIPQENTVAESESSPTASEEVPDPVAFVPAVAEQSEDTAPATPGSEMENAPEEDRNVLAAALLESGVLMTPSGYRIPDKEEEPSHFQPESAPVAATPPEVPVSEPKQESAPLPTSRHLPVAPAQPSISHPYASTGPAIHDIELRAVFGTEESFTLTRVAQKVAQMDGVVSCAIVTPDDVIENFTDQADAIGHKTKDLAEHVRCLASATGVEGAAYFTLHMDQVIMSFFFGDQHLLGVKHAPEAFKPGGREKLVLVARSLEGLEK